jgi:hypothetical protein
MVGTASSAGGGKELSTKDEEFTLPKIVKQSYY